MIKTASHPVARAARSGFVLSVLVLLALAGGAAQALTAAGVAASGAPGGSATVHFVFDFGTATSFESMAFGLQWNPDELTLLGSDASYQGAPANPAAGLSAVGLFSDNLAPGSYTFTWYALDPGSLDPLPPVLLSGAGSLSYSFGLAADLDPGQTSVVSMMLEGDGGEFMANAPVSVVPEPAAWSLALAGLAGLAALGAAGPRRRSGAIAA